MMFFSIIIFTLSLEKTEEFVMKPEEGSNFIDNKSQQFSLNDQNLIPMGQESMSDIAKRQEIGLPTSNENLPYFKKSDSSIAWEEKPPTLYNYRNRINDRPFTKYSNNFSHHNNNDDAKYIRNYDRSLNDFKSNKNKLFKVKKIQKITDAISSGTVDEVLPNMASKSKYGHQQNEYVQFVKMTPSPVTNTANETEHHDEFQPDEMSYEPFISAITYKVEESEPELSSETNTYQKKFIEEGKPLYHKKTNNELIKNNSITEKPFSLNINESKDKLPEKVQKLSGKKGLDDDKTDIPQQQLILNPDFQNKSSKTKQIIQTNRPTYIKNVPNHQEKETNGFIVATEKTELSSRKELLKEAFDKRMPIHHENKKNVTNKIPSKIKSEKVNDNYYNAIMTNQNIVNMVEENDTNINEERKINRFKQNGMNLVEQSRVNIAEQNKINEAAMQNNTNITEQNKFNSEQHKLNMSEPDKINLSDQNKRNLTELNKVIVALENNITMMEQNKFNNVLQNKINMTEQKSNNIAEQNKNNTSDEKKVNMEEQKKFNCAEQNAVNMLKQNGIKTSEQENINNGMKDNKTVNAEANTANMIMQKSNILEPNIRNLTEPNKIYIAKHSTTEPNNIYINIVSQNKANIFGSKKTALNNQIHPNISMLNSKSEQKALNKHEEQRGHKNYISAEEFNPNINSKMLSETGKLRKLEEWNRDNNYRDPIDYANIYPEVNLYSEELYSEKDNQNIWSKSKDITCDRYITNQNNYETRDLINNNNNYLKINYENKHRAPRSSEFKLEDIRESYNPNNFENSVYNPKSVMIDEFTLNDSTL